ncbi:MAG TPA: MMPL family transporter, partial [Solirubrobacteraceae bacterium]|nr:MMPL family transporter [Solirubrobacteraceae bacterium]
MKRSISVNAAYEGLGRFVIRFRWAIVVFWLAAAVVTSAAFPSLGSEINNNNSAFLSSSAPSAKAANLAAPLLGGGVNSNISEIEIVGSAPHPLTAGDLAAMQRVARLAAGVQRVKSAELLGLSADREAVTIRVRARLSANDVATDKTVIDALHNTFSHANAPADLQLHLAGQVATIVANQQSSNRAGNQVQTFSFLFVIVLLLLVFRSLPAAIVTLLPSGLALVISMRLIGALGAGGLKISSITEVLLIVLLIGAGTDYGLFLVFRVREELRDGHEPQEAVERALVRVGESITG